MHKSSHDKMSWFKNTYLNDNDFLDILDADCYRFYEDGMSALAKYVDFEVIHVSTNADAKPWCDTCLVAKKTGSLVNSGDNLERRMDNLENKLDAILNSIKK